VGAKQGITAFCDFRSTGRPPIASADFDDEAAISSIRDEFTQHDDFSDVIDRLGIWRSAQANK
jgi:hypothetical protein